MKKKWISRKQSLKLKKQAAKNELVAKIRKLSGKGVGKLIERDSSISEALSLVRGSDLEKRK